MSNGHYTALVDANRIMYRALVDILVNPYTIDRIREIARIAVHAAEDISNRNGITQPNNEMENSNVR